MKSTQALLLVTALALLVGALACQKQENAPMTGARGQTIETRAGIEQVEILSVSGATAEQYQDNINNWLQIHGNSVEITRVAQSPGTVEGRPGVTITVFYKRK